MVWEYSSILVDQPGASEGASLVNNKMRLCSSCSYYDEAWYSLLTFTELLALHKHSNMCIYQTKPR